MKHILYTLLFIGVFSGVSWGQSYLVSTTSGSVTTCAGTLYDSGGSGSNYANNENNVMTINPATAGSKVQLAFTIFNTESSFDFVDIFDGPTTGATLLGSYSGTTLPGTFTSTHTSGALTVRFRSDGTTRRAGFAATISCVAAPSGSSYSVSTTSGSITTCSGTLYDSGGASGDYTSSESNVMTINPATAGSAVRLAFTAFDTESTYDYVDIFDGPTTGATLLGSFTGTTLPGTFTSTHASGALTVRFRSDASVVRAGFAATISCVAPPPAASYLMSTTSGSITTCSGALYDSGGSAGSYTDGEDRTMVINPGTAGQAIRLVFTVFDTESCCDYISIYDGPTTGATLLGTFQGTTLPGTFTSSHASGALTVVFHSDGSITGAGFAATISCTTPAPPSGPSYVMSVTSGSATTCSGTIYDSGGSSGSYSDSEDRSFTINPSTAGAMVRFILTSIDLESCCDYIQIYNGPSSASPMLIQLAGNTLPAVTSYTSTHPTGALTIVFHSDGSVVGAGFSGTLSCITPPPPINTSACSGTFTDGGGNYGNDVYQVYTICPSTAGSKSTVQFTQFNLEDGHDYMYVYDGNSTSAPLMGVYTNTTSPGLTSASPSNASGCLTFLFTSDASGVAAGWSGTIGCTVPCQTITASISTTPVASGGTVRVCQGGSVTFNGSGVFSSSSTGATYRWRFSDGVTATGASYTRSFTTAGSYSASLTITDPSNCSNTNAANMIVEVSTTPTFATTASPTSICAGSTATLTAATTMTPYAPVCTPPVSGTTFLPDGTGVSYLTSINVSCYNSTQVINSATDISRICMTLEHSYLGDLNLRLICPNGQSTILHAYPTPANSGYYLGSPIDDDADLSAGTGLNYCFDNTATTYLYQGTTSSRGTPAGTSIDAGTYMPTQSFSNLVGCPVNGTWSVEVTDNIGSDNGYIFNWDLDFAPSVPLASGSPFTPTIASAAWLPATGLTNVNSTTANVVPTATGSQCYTYRITDNFGCSYDAPARCITVNPSPSVSLSGASPICAGNSTTLTASGTGTTYSWSNSLGTGTSKTVTPASTTTYTVTATAAGCTSVTNFTVTVSAAPTANAGPTATVCQGAAQALSGSTTNATGLTWTSSGTGTFSPNVNTANATYTPSAADASAGTVTLTLAATGGCAPASSTTTLTVATTSTTPVLAPVSGTLCPNSNALLNVTGGTAGTGSVVRWYTAANGGGSLVATGNSTTVAPITTTTYYVRREGICNTTTDAIVTVNVKDFIYALNGTSTTTFCTDNAGWHHFYVGDEIILSLQGDVSSMGTITATIMDNNAYYMNGGNPALCATGWTPGEQQFEMERNWNIAYTGALNGTYNVRFYYHPNERSAVETAAANWLSTYAACGYGYKYNPGALGWFWFKNTLGNYTAPDYDGLHLVGAGNGTVGSANINYSIMGGVTSFSGGTGGVILVPNVLLASELLNLRGRYDATTKYDVLNWETASETNNARFEIERSATAADGFVKIGEVAGQGTTQVAHNYQFEDRHPLIGINYYRLRQVDFDGTVTYSQVIAVQTPTETDSYTVYPNPTAGTVTYQFYLGTADKVQIEVLNTLGQVIQTQQFELMEGTQRLDMDLSDYPNGAYTLRIKHQNSNAVRTEKIIKAAN